MDQTTLRTKMKRFLQLERLASDRPLLRVILSYKLCVALVLVHYSDFHSTGVQILTPISTTPTYLITTCR